MSIEFFLRLSQHALVSAKRCTVLGETVEDVAKSVIVFNMIASKYDDIVEDVGTPG